MQDVFISYSSKDKEVAEKICIELEKAGITCWIAPRNINAGENWGEEIIKGIEGSKVLVLVFSSASNKSPQVLREVERAVSKEVAIINFRIENIEPSPSMEYFLYANHWLEAYENDINEHIEELKVNINSLLNNINESNLNNKEHSKKLDKNPKDDLRKYHKILAQGIGVLAVVGILAIAVNLNAIRKQMQDQPLETAVSFEMADSKQDKLLQAKERAAKEAELITKELKTKQSQKEDDDVKDDTEKSDSMSDEEGQVLLDIGQQVTLSNEADNSSEHSMTDEEKISTSEHSQKVKTQKKDVQKATFKVGEEITFGKYYNTPIQWIVIHVDQEGNPLLWTKDIITLKCYDGAESGVFDQDKSGNKVSGYMPSSKLKTFYSDAILRQMRGSNNWKNSNIRAWLNSSSKKVTYIGAQPVPESTSAFENLGGYQNEPGFLYQFSEEDKKLIKSITHKSILSEMDAGARNGGNGLFKFEDGNQIVNSLFNYSSAYYANVKDEVFLLSIEEVADYVVSNGISAEGNLTPQALKNDNTQFSEMFGADKGKTMPWWLRTPDSRTSMDVCFVNEEGILIDAAPAGYAGYGVRPALYLNATDCKVENGVITAK